MRRPLLAIAMIGLMASACGYSSNGIDGEWRLVEGTLQGEQILTESGAGDMGGSSREVTLLLQDDEANGRGPCNLYGGRLEVNVREGSGFAVLEFGIDWGDVFSNLSSCGHEADDTESAYFEALLQTDQGRRDGDVMTLLGSDARLEFELGSATS